MMGRNRRDPAGRQRSSLKARLGIAAAIVAGSGAIGAVAVAATSHPGATTAQPAGYSKDYSLYSSQVNNLNAGLNAFSWSHARAFAYFSHLANTNRETEMWRGHTKLAFERGTVVLATKKFIIVRAANGSLNLWLLSGGTKVTNVAGSKTGTTALTGSTWAADAAMNGQAAPATAMLTGNTVAAQQMLAPTAATVTVNVVGTNITVSVKVTGNMATVTQNKMWWRQPAMTTVGGVQRGDLVFIAGTRSNWTLHAKVILIEKTPILTATPAPAVSSTAPAGNHM